MFHISILYNRRVEIISPFRFFEIYTAVVLHFTSDSYDFFKFGGKTKVNENSLLKRKDKYFFEKMAAKCTNEEMAIGMCVCNTIADKKYIRNYDMNEYHKWIAYRDALAYKFKEDLAKYQKWKNDPKTVNPRTLLIELLIMKELSPEFIILFNHIMKGHLYKTLDKEPEFFIWEDQKIRLKKYEPFVLSLWHICPAIEEELKKSALG